MTEIVGSTANGAVAFRVYGLPVAQGRPRVARLPTGQVQVYDPAASREWKQHVRVQALQTAGGHPAMLEGPLEMHLSFELPRPKSAPSRRVYPDRRPDLDNLTKAVKDALRSVCYADDAQVVRMELDKHYGKEPGVAIHVRMLEWYEAYEEPFLERLAKR